MVPLLERFRGKFLRKLGCLTYKNQLAAEQRNLRHIVLCVDEMLTSIEHGGLGFGPEFVARMVRTRYDPTKSSERERPEMIDHLALKLTRYVYCESFDVDSASPSIAQMTANFVVSMHPDVVLRFSALFDQLKQDIVGNIHKCPMFAPEHRRKLFAQFEIALCFYYAMNMEILSRVSFDGMIRSIAK